MIVRTILAVVALLVVVGCKPNENAEAMASPIPQHPMEASGGGNEPQVVTPGAGAVAPVTGGVNYGSSAGGVGQVAKDRARGVAGGAGRSSLDQMPAGE